MNQIKIPAWLKLAFASLLLSISCGAIAVEKKLNVSFDKLSVEDGLSQESILAIAQDRRGYMWFGTQEGLNRFDGHEFKIYVPDDSRTDAISHYWIFDIVEGRDGYLWVATDGGGVNRYDPKTDSFKHFRHDPTNPNSLSSDRTRTIYQDSSGFIWVGTLSGLDRLDPYNGEVKRFQHNADDETSLSSNYVRDIIEDHNGNLWIATFGGGLNRLDQLHNTFMRIPFGEEENNSLTSGFIFSLSLDRDGYLWIGTKDKGASRYHTTQNRFQHFQHSDNDPNSLAGNKVKSFLQDEQGRFWIATDGGLDLWLAEQNRFEHFRDDPTQPRSLVDNRVTNLFQDSGQVIWIGTQGGISKWNPVSQAFTHYRREPGLPFGLFGGVVNALTMDSSGNIWIGTEQHGLNYINRQTGEVTGFTHDSEQPNSLANNRVMSLWLQDDRYLWIGTYSKGLDRLDLSTGQFTHYQHDPNNETSIQANGVTSIYPAGEKGMWVATYGGGLNFFDYASESFISFKHDPEQPTSISSNAIISLLQVDDNTLWLGTFGGGLDRMDINSGEFTHFVHKNTDKNSLSDNTVWSLYQDHQGVLWAGTHGGGFNRITFSETGAVNIKRFGRREGMLSNTVYGIVEGAKGELWLSTNKGLARFSPSDESLLHFNINHGLQGMEFNSGAYYRARDGELLFGGKNGINAFYPARVVSNQHQANAVINAVYLGDQLTQLPFEQQILKITHRDYLVSIEYAGLDYAESAKNRFQYRLKGFDEKWIDAGAHRRATYTKLPSGEYLFEVRASNNSGLWNPVTAKLKIEVAPAPWFTWWAYLIYSLTVIAAIALYVQKQAVKYQQKANYSKQLELKVHSRTQELAERNQLLESLNNKLQQASVTDSLTGLKNRRYLEGFATQQAAEIDREFEVPNIHGERRQMFFGMIDLDNLKHINDNYGHKAGDQAIKHVAQILKQECRAADTLIRWGGDEFMVIGHVFNEQTIERISQRIRSTVESLPFQVDKTHAIQLSCSIGMSFYPFCTQQPKILNWEQVAALADKAMYLAKQYGQNDWVAIFNRQKLCSIEEYNNILNAPLEAKEKGIVELKVSRESIFIDKIKNNKSRVPVSE